MASEATKTEAFTHETGLSHLLHSARTAPDHGTPERNMVAAENLSAAGAFPETDLPVLRQPEESAIDRALRGKCFIPTF